MDPNIRKKIKIGLAEFSNSRNKLNKELDPQISNIKNLEWNDESKEARFGIIVDEEVTAQEISHIETHFGADQVLVKNKTIFEDSKLENKIYLEINFSP